MNTNLVKTLLQLRKASVIAGSNKLILHGQTWTRRLSSEPLTWSYVSNPGQRPLLGLTMGQVVDRADQLYGDREALVDVHHGIRMTFSQVKNESKRIAAGLVALGLGPGDRLAIWATNSYEWYLTMMAAAKAGLILVNINPSYRPDELQHCLNSVAVKAIICDEKFKISDYYQMLCTLAPELPSSAKGELQSTNLPHLKHVIIRSQGDLSGAYKFRDLYEAGDSSHMKSLELLSSKINFDDPCNIQFTSGTTGLPKATLLSHHMIVNNAYFTGKRAEYDQQVHRNCLSLPLHHCFGYVIGVLAGALHGAATILPSPGFHPEAILHAIESERITSCYGTPTMFVDILNAQRKSPRDVSSLSTGMIGGAPCPQTLITDIMDELNMKGILVVYGMTETSPITFLGFPTDPPSVRSSTIGYPGDHIEAKVTDQDGRVVPIGEAGELCIRGYCNFLRYWGQPEKTMEVVTPDRWLKTGDLAVIQPDGYGRIIGRIKDVVIRGGENIFPAEVENFLMTHPSVSEAQVVGVHDDRMGEELAAWIRTADGAELTETLLKDWCKGKMAHFKIPRYIFFKEEFPRTATGKIQKFKMREVTEKELNLI